VDRVPLLDLKAQYAPLKKDIERVVREVMDQQAFILGPNVQAFEEELARFVGVEHAIGCASGTDALILALAAIGVGEGDEVLTTPFSFFATASCAYKVGARPVFCDIDPDTFNIDPARVEDAITSRTRAMLPVHLFGQCAEMDTLCEIAERRGIAVVEDAAQALSATYRSESRNATLQSGAIGQLGCYSFFPSKNLGGFGDGGAVVTRDGGLAERLRKLRVHGEKTSYHHVWVGWNSRLDALQAAVLRVKLPHLASWSEARARNAERYNGWFAEAGLVESGQVRVPVAAAHSAHIYNQYTLRVERRDALREHLNAAGVGHSVYYPVPLHRQECFRDLGYGEGDFPEAARAAAEVVSLPVYPELTEGQQQRVVETIAAFYGKS
jgi:dTDP-4-amino-4,6-dideoxygalactose transaminase